MKLFHIFTKKNTAQSVEDNKSVFLNKNEKFDIDVYREKFFMLIQPYHKAGLLREIYRCNHFSVYAFGEKVYIACPYIMLDEIPYGIYMNPTVLRKIIQKNRMIYPIINEVFSDVELNKNLLFFLDEDQIPYWREWMIKNKYLSKIDEALEQEIKR